MDRQSLRKLLDREDVDPDAYSLGAASRDDTYVLEQTADRWEVYFSERGLRIGERHFTTEDEACRHLLDLLLRDSTTRRR